MREEMPIGFGFALAENEKAMSSFAKMTEEEKKQVMEAARSVPVSYTHLTLPTILLV